MKNIDELEGRELDAAVAERVMGWDGVRPDVGVGIYMNSDMAWPELIPQFSANAWPAVLDAMEARGWVSQVRGFPNGNKYAKFWRPETMYNFHSARADTRAEAVARAALRALASEGVTHD